MQNPDTDTAALAEEIKNSLHQILEDMTASRAREGAKMKALILERLAEAEKMVATVKPLLPLQIKAYQERLTAKLQEALRSCSPGAGFICTTY
ncbi:MAG: hypothetical protein RLZZ351_608 [Pseudomonadota bacterium]